MGGGVWIDSAGNRHQIRAYTPKWKSIFEEHGLTFYPYLTRKLGQLAGKYLASTLMTKIVPVQRLDMPSAEVFFLDFKNED
jgi:hypothetical protein